MRYLRVQTAGGPRAGLLHDDHIALLDADPLAGPASPTGETLPLAGARLLPPTEPTKILGVGTNYRAHAVEMGKPIPDEPLLFMKPPSALVGSGAAIVRPRGPWERVDFEGELCLVIGRPARRVSVEDAHSYVFGYTICNDVTVRELQKKDGQFTRAKGFDTFCPVGPVIATGLDPSNLRLVTRVNGAVRQDSSTSDLIFSVGQLIACASRVMTLLPGDLITTGTPSGVGPLRPGDTVEIEIEGIGTLANHVVDEDEAPAA